MPGLAAAAGIEHSLPWYFGAAVFVSWAALMVILISLTRRRVRAWRERRTAATRAMGRRIRDDQSIGPGTDVEPW